MQYEDTDIVSRQLRHIIFKEYIFGKHTPIEDLQLIRLNGVQRALDRFLPRQLMVVVGERETMRDDILDFAEAAKKDETREVVVVNEDYAHDWFLVHDIVDRKGKHLIAKCDALFADFVVNAVNTHRDDMVDDDNASVSTSYSTVKSENDGTVQIEITIDEEKGYMEKDFADVIEYNYQVIKEPTTEHSFVSKLCNIFKQRKIPFLFDYFFGKDRS
jgi:hypothetical protein